MPAPLPTADFPMAGRRILVTRPLLQSSGLAADILAAGGVPVCFPLLAIEAIDDTHALERAALDISQYSRVIFASPNAVRYALPVFRAAKVPLATLPASAIGRGTATCLAAEGCLQVVFPREHSDSEALLALPAFQEEAIAGKKILLLRGETGRTLLPETLAERGASVDCVACYRRLPPRDTEELLTYFHNQSIDALTLSSSEALRHLYSIVDGAGRQFLRSLPSFVSHRRIGAMALDLGLSNIIVCAEGDAGIMKALVEFNWGHRREDV